MRRPPDLGHFEATVLVHLDAAYNLARWITRDGAAAEDAVQDACVRALRHFDTLSGPSPKAWFMAIVRNTCIDWLRGGARRSATSEYDDDVHGSLGGGGMEGVSDAGARASPESLAMQASDARWVHTAIAALPMEFREAIVLRELEELSYKEISAIVNVPIGTVMSRISRGRDLLVRELGAGVKRAAR